jgi:hypothetical protein
MLIRGIEYIESKGKFKCCICNSPLFGKVKVGSEKTSFCYSCAANSLRSCVDEMIERNFGIIEPNKN